MKKQVLLFYHPIVILIYFSGIIVCNMLTLHPGLLLTSFICGSLYFIFLKGFRDYLNTLKFLALMLILIALLNPIFNSSGNTVLFYWLNGRKFTLESLLFGVSSSFMISSVVFWFMCCSEVLTTEKFVYIFGKTWPTLSMILTMIFRFVPEMIKRWNDIDLAQQAVLGKNIPSKKMKMLYAARINSVLMSWSMENSIETTYSMLARGYGCGKRTSYTRYRMHKYDLFFIICVVSLLVVCSVMFVIINANITFFPQFDGMQIDIWIYILFIVLLSFPLLLEVYENIRCINLK